MSILLFVSHVLIVSHVFGFSTPPVNENVRELFEQFKRKYEKVYSNGTEEERRFDIFKRNLVLAAALQKQEKGTAKYGMTKFSDLTTEEFAALFANASFDARNITQEMRMTERADLGQPWPSFDWRLFGAVTPVAQQGQCGSCWAFSVVGNIESLYYLRTGILNVLSKQQLLDCNLYGYGCNGGHTTVSYAEVIRMRGLFSEAAYPYLGVKALCRVLTAPIMASIRNFLILSTDEAYQAAFLAVNGPLSTLLDARLLQFYQRGIFSPSPLQCSALYLNHAVLTVGYGQESGFPFWIVKNSWGANWGESGYFRILRGFGTCGINQVVTTSVV